MGYACKDVEKTMKFVRYQEGAELYSIGLTEAKAVQKIDKVALINCEIFEKYLETFFKKILQNLLTYQEYKDIIRNMK